jgi:hypothetical protein
MKAYLAGEKSQLQRAKKIGLDTIRKADIRFATNESLPHQSLKQQYIDSSDTGGLGPAGGPSGRTAANNEDPPPETSLEGHIA